MGSMRYVYIHDPDMRLVKTSGHPEFSQFMPPRRV